MKDIADYGSDSCRPSVDDAQELFIPLNQKRNLASSRKEKLFKVFLAGAITALILLGATCFHLVLQIQRMGRPLEEQVYC